MRKIKGKPYKTMFSKLITFSKLINRTRLIENFLEFKNKLFYNWKPYNQK